MRKQPSVSLRTLARRVGRLPPVLAWRAARYEQRFASAAGNVRLFRGIYQSYVEAAASVPKTRPLGYDNPASATRLEADRHRIFPSDYPVLFWLSKLLPTHPRVFDYGGHVGISFYAYRRLLDLPAETEWTVCDLPAIVERGRQIAAEHPAPGLRFTTEPEGMAGRDILLAAGVLHFLPDPIGFLRQANVLPPHVILNKVPLTERPAAVTVEAMGTAFSPYHLLNAAALVGTLEQRGYRQVDRWSIPELGCTIPFHPEYSISGYTGFYFVRDLADQAATGAGEARSMPLG